MLSDERELIKCEGYFHHGCLVQYGCLTATSLVSVSEEIVFHLKHLFVCQQEEW